MPKQRTIKSLVKTVGIGLHSGRKVTLTLRPAADVGIVFTRVDLPELVEIPASAMAIGDTRLASAEGWCARFHGRAPDVGLRRPGHRQPLCRRRCRRDPDPTAAPPPSCSCCSRPASKSSRRPRFIRVRSRWKCAKATARPAGALFWLQAKLHHRLPPPGGRQDRSDLLHRFRRYQLRARDRARAHLRLRPRVRGPARDGPMRRQPGQRHRAGRTSHAQQRGAALRRRVRAPQDPRCDR